MPEKQPVVLVVDDDPETLKIFSYFLDKEGYTALMARTVDEALASIEGSPPDITLLDMMLPGRSGIDLLKHIRSTDALANTYVIVISAHALDEHRLPDGVLPDETLRKPIRLSQLQAAINRGLD